PASTGTSPGAGRRRAASRSSSRPGSGAAAPSFPRARIPTPSCARRAAWRWRASSPPPSRWSRPSWARSPAPRATPSGATRRRRGAEALAQRDETERQARLEALPRDIRERVVRRLLEERPDVERERALADCIAHIRRRGPRGEERRVRDEIRAAQARGDSEAVEAAMRRLKQLMDETQAEKART